MNDLGIYSLVMKPYWLPDSMVLHETSMRIKYRVLHHGKYLSLMNNFHNIAIL